MREHPDEADCDAALKAELSRTYAADRAGYTLAKTPFLWETMQAADRWSQQFGWVAGPSDA